MDCVSDREPESVRDEKKDGRNKLQKGKVQPPPFSFFLSKKSHFSSIVALDTLGRSLILALIQSHNNGGEILLQ